MLRVGGMGGVCIFAVISWITRVAIRAVMPIGDVQKEDPAPVGIRDDKAPQSWTSHIREPDHSAVDAESRAFELEATRSR